MWPICRSNIDRDSYETLLSKATANTGFWPTSEPTSKVKRAIRDMRISKTMYSPLAIGLKTSNWVNHDLGSGAGKEEFSTHHKEWEF